MTDLSSARSKDDPEVAGRGADIIFSSAEVYARWPSQSLWLSLEARLVVASLRNRSGMLSMLQEAWPKPEDAEQSWQGMCWRDNCNYKSEENRCGFCSSLMSSKKQAPA